MSTEQSYFLPISDVSKKMGLPSHVLRFWEKQFPNFVKPTTGAGGRRYYRTTDIENLERIKDLLYRQGYTIRGVKKLLASGGGAMVGAAAGGAEPAPRSIVDGGVSEQVVELLLSARLALKTANE
ncbi:MAG: MerR family transcriptional regulator [Rickettsiales bacterium]|jgi:DNA-binding transcriptional MerR regulator|nr:MerR family transcriptional regulator [Rickettsiales bacterium]